MASTADRRGEVRAPQVRASRSATPRRTCRVPLGANAGVRGANAGDARVEGARVLGASDGLSLLVGFEDILATVGRGPAADEKIIEVVVDSGAVESVAPPGLFPGTVEPSATSKAGRTYRAANGSRIRNLGQVRVPFTSPEGHRCNLPFQVAEVERALLSVSHLARSGNRVELHDEGGTITNKETGKTMALVRRGGV